jgi:hypothetical protein
VRERGRPLPGRGDNERLDSRADGLMPRFLPIALIWAVVAQNDDDDDAGRIQVGGPIVAQLTPRGYMGPKLLLTSAFITLRKSPSAHQPNDHQRASSSFLPLPSSSAPAVGPLHPLPPSVLAN